MGAGNGGLLRAAVGAVDLDPELRRSLREGDRHRGTAESCIGHELEVPSVKSGWSSTLVTKYVAPPATPSPSSLMSRNTSAGFHTSRRLISSWRTSEHEHAQHSHEMANRGPGNRGGAARRREFAELAGFEPNCPMGMDHALRIPGRARREGDQCRPIRVDDHGLVDRFRIQEPLKGSGMRREPVWVGCAHDGPGGSEVTQ